LDQLLTKERKRNRKGGQDAIDWLTALPNKKGEDRKERLPLGISIVGLITSKKRNRNRKGRLRCSQLADCSPKQNREKTGKKGCN